MDADCGQQADGMKNLILNTDSYKLGHFLQYPPEVRRVSGYVTTRGKSFWPEVVFFGLQMFLKEYLSKPISRDDVDEAEDIAGLHGQPFDRVGWQRIIDAHGGYLPLSIEALPEGMTVRRDTVLAQVVNTDPQLPWLTGHIETSLLRAIWYPSTIASLSRRLKETLRPFYEKSSDNPEALLDVSVADYGARATTTSEQAGIGGLAHLIHFRRTDTLAAVVCGRRYYGAQMVGFSLPASEHTTMLAWGREKEAAAFRNMVEQFSGSGAYSVVSDSFDLANAVSEIWGKELHDMVVQSGATLIVRPDSGDPIDTPVQVVAQLAYAFGTHLNTKGYKVINHQVRVLQSDAVSVQDMSMVLGRLEGMGFSAENISFGMGSSLLQKASRDSFSFTMRCSAYQDDKDTWHDMARRPVVLRDSEIKAGRRAVVSDDGDTFDIPLSELGRRANLLQPVWQNGELLREWTFEDVIAATVRR
ncbi:nicotinate phosphoribosyltransferase [Ciceribacter sp. L1K23]|nr:nicotinate phosphoribosyltransferase [Ciceribacter sp. L1K23]